jgi:hypothetical protein
MLPLSVHFAIVNPANHANHLPITEAAAHGANATTTSTTQQTQLPHDGLMTTFCDAAHLQGRMCNDSNMFLWYVFGNLSFR